MLFSIEAVPIYISANSGGGFPFFHTLSIIYFKYGLIFSSYDFNLFSTWHTVGTLSPFDISEPKADFTLTLELLNLISSMFQCCYYSLRDNYPPSPIPTVSFKDLSTQAFKIFVNGKT